MPGARSFGTSLPVVASLFLIFFLVLFPDRHPAASTKQAVRTERASPLLPPLPQPAPSLLRTPLPQPAPLRPAVPPAVPLVDVPPLPPPAPLRPAVPPAVPVVDVPSVAPAEPPPVPAEHVYAVPSEEDTAAMPGHGRDDILASHQVPIAAPAPEPGMDEVNQYLWSVYQRTVRKQDNGGDFTWKDVAAAAHLGISLGDYVIVGMDRDFRELMYHAGLAMDAAGMRWTILSAFRDDYRQGLATGYKARIGDSLHGGSATTGGYGHGCAIDISDADGKSVPLWKWIDANSIQVGLERPLPGIDPAHIQARGAWHAFAAALRAERLAKDTPSEDVPSDSELADLSALPPTDIDMLCVGLHHHRAEPQLASASPETTTFDAARVPPVVKVPAKVEVKPSAKPEANKSEANKPEANKPEASKPEASKTEAKLPAKPDTNKTETNKPETNKAEPAKPEANKPEAKLPAKTEKAEKTDKNEKTEKNEKAHPRTAARVATRSPAAETDKGQSHSKASARSLAHHALHAPPRPTGAA